MNNLVDHLFDRSKNFQMGIFCTYSLNLEFFENYLLNLSGVTNCSNLCVFTDRAIYNSHFNINSSSKPKWINRRYLVTPIDTGGVFHPKLYLLASDKEIRIGIGSSNLTREGLASNLEIVSIFEITEKNRVYSGFLKECLNFLRDVAVISKSYSAIESVNKFIAFTSHFIVSDVNSEIHLIHNLKEAIMPKVIEALKGNRVKSIKVISPFYDKKLKVHQFLKNTYPNAMVTIYIQQGKSNFPVENYDFFNDRTEIYLYKDQDRYIHGKAIIFETDKKTYLLTGSINYTKSALLTGNLKANIEIAVLGEINANISNELCQPKGQAVGKLQNIGQLSVVSIEDRLTLDDDLIVAWLIEVLYINNQLQISLNENSYLTPKYVVINGDEKNKIEYSSFLNKKAINKSELIFAHIEGYDNNKKIVKSSKVWIVNLDKEREFARKKRFCINDPSEISLILLELMTNGSEQELIEYLLRFNIPLDLVVFNPRGKVIGAIESKGNVFGELIQQSESVFKNPELLEAAQQFLVGNIKKLYAHYNDLQLNKLENFMLIYGTIFNMMNVFNDYIVRQHSKNPIKAKDWAIMRNYYDMMLQKIEEILFLIWVPDENMSFEELLNDKIKNDKQQLLGSIYSFKNYIVKRDYEYMYKLSLDISRKIIRNLDIYIEKAKIMTVNKTIVKAPIARNGMKDNFIIRRKIILKLVKELLSDFEKWER